MKAALCFGFAVLKAHHQAALLSVVAAQAAAFGDIHHYLLTRMGEHQTIVTTCDTAAFARTNGKIVMVKGGTVAEP